MDAINRGVIKPLDAELNRLHACPLNAPARPIKPQVEPLLLPLATTGARHPPPTSVLLARVAQSCRRAPQSIVGPRRSRWPLSPLRFGLGYHDFKLTDVFFSSQSASSVATLLGASPDAASTFNGTAVPPRCSPYL